MNRRDAMPANVDAERFVLGSILLDDAIFPDGLSRDHFSLDSHRRIFRAMSDLRSRGERVDRLTVVDELDRRGERESAGGLSYLVSLDDGLPQIPSIDAYTRILEEHATRRRVMVACKNLIDRAGMGSENVEEILRAGQDLFATAMVAGQSFRSIDDIPALSECGPTDIEYAAYPEFQCGSVVAICGPPGCGKSTFITSKCHDAWVNRGIPSVILDRENPLAVIAERFARLGITESPGMHVWGGWLSAEAPSPDAQIVRTWAKERKGIIVVDAVTAFLNGDANDASVMRAMLHPCRRLADLGATVVLNHHTGKAESAKDYRGSSDFPAAIDTGYTMSNFGDGGQLGTVVLRPFKARMGGATEITYRYVDGKFIRADQTEVRQTVSEQLTTILRLNPGMNGGRFEELAVQRGISRGQARSFLSDGLSSGAVHRRVGAKNSKTYSLRGTDGDL